VGSICKTVGKTGPFIHADIIDLTCAGKKYQNPFILCPEIKKFIKTNHFYL